MVKISTEIVKTPFGPTALNGSNWNPQNQYQPLFSTKDQSHKISKELVHWNKSYRTETLLSTDADDADDDDTDDSVIP